MKGILSGHALFLAAVAVSGLAAQTPEELIDQALRYRTIGQLEAKGDLVAFTVTRLDLEENVANSDIWVHDASAQRTYALTRGPKADENPHWSNSGEKLAFVSDRNGKRQIFVISPYGGEAEQATKFEKLAVNDLQWLPDDSGFVFVAADPPTEEEEKRKKDKEDTIVVDHDLKYARLYRYKLGEKDPEKLTTGELHVTSFDLSPDGRQVAFSATPSPKANDGSRSDVYLLDLGAQEARALVRLDGEDGDPKFSPDGAWVAFTRQAGMQSNSVLHQVRTDGSGLESLSTSFDESVGSFDWVDGGRIELSGRRGTENRVFELSLAGKTVKPLGAFDEGVEVESFARGASKRAYAVLSGPQKPAELYRIDSPSSASAVTQLNKEFAQDQPRVERFRYKAADGWDLEGLLLTPPDAAGAKLPLLVVIHGGPAGVHSLRFRPSQGAWPIHAFLHKGYAVFLPNPRGSTGFGEEFRKAVVDDWGGKDFGDIQRGVDLLIERGTADPEHMGVMGWSYGGYMTAWTITQTDRYKAASVGAGITNAISMYGTQDIPDFFESHFGDEKPWEDPKAYTSRSAVSFVANVKTPTLIQHGAEDRRVPVGQAQELYLALKKVGVETELTLYPRQGHGIGEPKLLRDAMLRSFHWFDERVGVR